MLLRIALALSLIMHVACAPAEEPPFHLIPLPQHVIAQPDTLELSGAAPVMIGDTTNAELARLGTYTADMLNDVLATAPTRRGPDDDTPAVHLRIDQTVDSLGDEGYALTVDAGGVVIVGATSNGLFYGIQTLRQLIVQARYDTTRTAASGGARIPALQIHDRPRFRYRGMHLDVGRHMFPVSFIKKYIDTISMYKFNTFHWHLTEDQGWRIEIKKYPLLTEVGGFRKETMVEQNFDPYVGDGTPYGGSYTQDEIREVVAYAAERYVTVIPEIEMPGHAKAALTAYPELACTDGPFEVRTTWGVDEDIYCPTETTFSFLEGVLTEVVELFPSEYIHIGGDEAPKQRWEESEAAQEVIRREGLADEHELQSYFVRRIERFLRDRGRRIIGWDEILEGGLAPGATVMSWRGVDGGIAAAQQGHDVIMTPTSHVYFDYYQADADDEPLAIGGFLPLEKVYSFEPVPSQLNERESQHVLGAQGNVWTEYMKTSDYVEYMAFPRALALAEVVWSPKSVKNWRNFAARLPTQLRFLDDHGVNHHVPDVP